MFINCPFDAEYRPLFRAAVFTIYFCGHMPRCALEGDDSGETRASRIIELIRDSRYGIHDLSRTEVSDGLPRFNMPFEFGVFVGFKHSGSRKQQSKRALVLDRERYRYQRLLSDMAGQDIKAHNDKPHDLIRCVRNWLSSQDTGRDLPGGMHVIEQYEAFTAESPRSLAKLNKTEADLENYPDFSKLAFGWIDANEPDA